MNYATLCNRLTLISTHYVVSNESCYCMIVVVLDVIIMKYIYAPLVIRGWYLSGLCSSNVGFMM